MVHGGGVITVVAEVATNSLEKSVLYFRARMTSVLIILFRPFKQKLNTKLKMRSPEITVCALHNCQSPIFLGDVLPELLINEFFGFCASPCYCV